MTTLKSFKGKYFGVGGYHLEVYYNGNLIDYRVGVNKTAFQKYKKCYEDNGYLSEGTKREYPQFKEQTNTIN